MAYFTPEQISKAKQIDLLTYLKNCNKEELIYESRNTYTTRTHDSLKINNGMWYWFSRGIGGKTALEYLIQVEGYSFTDAVSHILGIKGLEKNENTSPIYSKNREFVKLVLPKKADNNLKVINYLMARGIDKEIIIECISKGFIYQEYQKNNVVFVGYDENNIPKYAGVRATNSSRYMHDAYGSDKTYSFKLESINKNNQVHLFESAIDLLSYATIKKLNNELWDEENLLSLAGVYRPAKDNLESKLPKTLSNYLKNNNQIDTIVLHLDNDLAGRLSTQAIQTILSDSYKIIDDPPKSGKDFNDYLCNLLTIKYKNKEENYR